MAALVPYVFGILLSTVIESSYLVGLSLAIIALIFTIYNYSIGKLRVSGLWALATMLFLGWFGGRFTADPFEPNHIQNLAKAGGRVVVYGQVSDEPDIRSDKTFLIVDVDSVRTGHYMIPSLGRVRARLYDGGSRYNHADYLMISGYIYNPSGSRNPLGFDYGAYLRTRNIHAGLSVNKPMDIEIVRQGKTFLGSVVSPLREYLLKETRAYLKPVSASILSGFILGERRDIPKDYQTMFRNTGTLHLMAVSGSNVGMVLAIFAIPLSFLGIHRRIRVVILLTVICFFALLTRLEPSVVRASIMASVGLLAYGWARKPDYVNIIAFAGLLMLLWNPQQVFDIGLQLSFGATFAIVYFLPRPISWLSRRRLARFSPLRWIAALSITTVAAQAAVMPLMARYFNNVPIAGIIANIPVGILAGLSTAGGVVFYFASLFGDWAARLAAYPLELLLETVKILLRLFSSFSAANINAASPSWPAILFYWIIIYIIYEAITRRRASATGIIVSLFALSSIAWSGFIEQKLSWRLDFIDIDKNRGWIFADDGGENIACFDIYDESYDPGQIIIPHIMNFFDGRIDYLVTSTPDSPTIKDLKSMFATVVISPDSIRSPVRPGSVTAYVSDAYRFLPSFFGKANVVWGKSDNKKDDSFFPLAIETGEGVMVFSAGDFDTEFAGIEVGKRITLLEMPWRTYARKSCLTTIEYLDPSLVVFSPDRHSAALPSSREELTHSKDFVLATSICGGFSLALIDGQMRMRTMRGLGDEGE